MRWTQTFIPTLKETPADAEIVSHQLLLRAGLVRKLTGGLYTFLPMGLRALTKVATIVREEMDRAGGIEVSMPLLQPTDIWHASGRYEAMRDNLYKVKDRAQKEWALCPTAEEVITTLAANEFSSYKQFPKNFYQVGTKFRDEIRPRFGLMRAKEFLMKDAYSFDTTDAGAMASYQKMYDAYTRIFARCGLRAFAVEADTGIIGGNHSHEFMIPAETGENDVVYCEACNYAANIEKAASGLPKTAPRDPGPAPEKFATPGVVTIEALAKDPYKVPANRQIKTLVFIADSKPVLILVRGDDQLNEAKFMAKTGAIDARPADAKNPADLVHFTALGAMPGSLGAVRNVPTGWKVLADERLRGANGMTTGANEDGFHLRDVSMDRDIQVTEWHDLRTVTAGEPCAKCAKPLKIRRAIEVGHVFKLGTKYSVPLNATFLDEAGQRAPLVMGCYGIGVTRTLQAVIEQGNDKDGIIWPVSVAPYHVCITPLTVAADSPAMKLAEQLYAELTQAGLEVIIDDRDERPGVKFKDSELVGFPIRIGLGEKSLAKGEVEIKPRCGALRSVKTEDAAADVIAWVKAEKAKLA
jgi:prolyl-tRNA synthetase